MVAVVFILGLAVGSFLNAWIYRMHNPHPALSHRERGWGEGSVWCGRSYCPKCKKPLSWYELIPLLSFVIQRGRCRGCHERIDTQYPLVEFVTGILFAFAFETTKLSFVVDALQSLALYYLLSALIVLFVYDLRYGLVPDRVVLPAIGVAVLSKLSFVQFSVKGLALIALSVIVGAGFFALQYYISKGRWLGAGDIRIGALMGAMLGFPFVVSGLVISYMVGGLVAVGLLIFGRKKFGQTLPLGTFLTLGTAIVFLYGEQIWTWYWR